MVHVTYQREFITTNMVTKGLHDAIYCFKGDERNFYKLTDAYTKSDIEEKIKQKHSLQSIETRYMNPKTQTFAEIHQNDPLPLVKVQGKLLVVVEVSKAEKSMCLRMRNL